MGTIFNLPEASLLLELLLIQPSITMSWLWVKRPYDCKNAHPYQRNLENATTTKASSIWCPLAKICTQNGAPKPCLHDFIPVWSCRQFKVERGKKPSATPLWTTFHQMQCWDRHWTEWSGEWHSQIVPSFSSQPLKTLGSNVAYYRNANHTVVIE
jgi:hypothetical protein